MGSRSINNLEELLKLKLASQGHPLSSVLHSSANVAIIPIRDPQVTDLHQVSLCYPSTPKILSCIGFVVQDDQDPYLSLVLGARRGLYMKPLFDSSEKENRRPSLMRVMSPTC